jgi:NTE family protein
MMNQAPAMGPLVKAAERVLPFERVVLVLQGGGALGAYQAGVYQAIQDAGIRIDWICGTSIGGINGAVLAGNRPERRLERLREFWDAVTAPPIRLPNIPWFTEAWSDNGHARYWTNRMSAFSTMFHGAPDFFTPRPFPPISAAAERPDQVSYYDTSPLRATLGRLVDFDLINEKPLRRFISTISNRRSAPRT